MKKIIFKVGIFVCDTPFNGLDFTLLIVLTRFRLFLWRQLIFHSFSTAISMKKSHLQSGNFSMALFYELSQIFHMVDYLKQCEHI